MKTLSKWNFSTIAGRIMMVLIAAAITGSIYAAPALGKDDRKHIQKKYNDRNDNRGHKDNNDRYDNRGHKNNNGRYDNKGHKVNNGRYGDKGRKDDNNRSKYKKNKYGRYEYKGYDCYRIVRGRRVYQPCSSRERVYTPPRAIYAPAPPPGIRIFFPPLLFPFSH